MSASYLMLPYANLENSRETVLSGDTELAGIVCAVESGRRKPQETGYQNDLKSLSQLYWPIWCVPWGKNSFLIDGMKLVSTRLSLPKPPDPEALVEAVKRSVKDEEQYLSTLRSEALNFRVVSPKEVIIAGHIADREMLIDITTYLKETRQIAFVSTSSRGNFLSPLIDSENAVKIKEEILEHNETLLSYIKGLQFALEFVAQETRVQDDSLQKELKEVQEDYSQQISTLTAAVQEKTAKLEDERSSELARITKVRNLRIEETLAEKQDLEKQLIRLEQDKSEYEKRKDLRKIKRDQPGEARWKVRLKQTKKQISTLKGKVKALSNRIDKTQKETEKAARRLNENYGRLIDEERMKVASLEKSRDLKIEGKRAELDELQQNSSTLTRNVNGLIEQIKSASTGIVESTVPWETSIPLLIGVPMYVARRQIEDRYIIFSPVIAQESKGLALTIGTAFGVSGLGSRIGRLLKQRSAGIEKLFTLLRGVVEKDKVLRRHMDEVVAANNLLKSPDFAERLGRGLENLEEEGWIKTDEKASVLSAFRS